MEQRGAYALFGGDTELGKRESGNSGRRSQQQQQQQNAREQRRLGAQGSGRLHGAFTGGFSAGYFNTAGSKEGWTPASFRSSRNDRRYSERGASTTDATADAGGGDERKGSRTVHQQRVEDFMDEDELEERRRASIRERDTFDTFGSRQRRLHEEAVHRRHQLNNISRTTKLSGAARAAILRPDAEDDNEQDERKPHLMDEMRNAAEGAGRAARQSSGTVHQGMFAGDARVSDIFTDGIDAAYTRSIGRRIVQTMKRRRNRARQRNLSTSMMTQTAGDAMHAGPGEDNVHDDAVDDDVDMRSTRYYDGRALRALVESHRQLMDSRHERMSLRVQHDALHGVGFDPHEHAPEFRMHDTKSIIGGAAHGHRGGSDLGVHIAGSIDGEKRSGRHASSSTAFGSVLEELDDDIYDDGSGHGLFEKSRDLNRRTTHARFALAYDSELDDGHGKNTSLALHGIGAGSQHLSLMLAHTNDTRSDAGDPLMIMAASASKGVRRGPFADITGFVEPRDSMATTSPQWFPAPEVPPSFSGRHQFRSKKKTGKEQGGADAIHDGTGEDGSVCTEVAPPADKAIQKTIETLAFYVAKNDRYAAQSGQSFEALARERERGKKAFAFLFGGEGADYYAYRLALARRLETGGFMPRKEQASRALRMDADERAAALGEIEHGTLERRRRATAEAQYQQRSNDAAMSSSQPNQMKLGGTLSSEDRKRIQESMRNMFTTSGGGGADTLRGSGISGRNFEQQLSLPAGLTTFAQASLHGRVEMVPTTTLTTSEGPDAQQERREIRSRIGRAFRHVDDFRPAPLLCKRFNVRDPYKGRREDYRGNTPQASSGGIGLRPPPPASILPPPPAPSQLPPRRVSNERTESHQRPSDADIDASTKAQADSFLESLASQLMASAVVEKPLTIFKAIFEDSEEEYDDDQDDEEEGEERHFEKRAGYTRVKSTAGIRSGNGPSSATTAQTTMPRREYGGLSFSTDDVQTGDAQITPKEARRRERQTRRAVRRNETEEERDQRRREKKEEKRAARRGETEEERDQRRREKKERKAARSDRFDHHH